MVLPGPQGTVQYPIRAPNEHSLHTKIMEKSLSLFFYCYQSVVHLQSSLSLTPLPPTLSSLFFCPFYPLSVHPCPLCRSHTLFCFPTLQCGAICGIQGEEGFGFIHQSFILSALVSPLVLAMSLFSLLCKQSSLSMLKNGAMATTARAEGKKNGSRIMKIMQCDLCRFLPFFFFFF